MYGVEQHLPWEPGYTGLYEFNLNLLHLHRQGAAPLTIVFLPVSVSPDLLCPGGMSLVGLNQVIYLWLILFEEAGETPFKLLVPFLPFTAIWGEVFPFIGLREVWTIAGKQVSHYILLHLVPFHLDPSY